MTQEDKELLLKDLSSRLPYGVKVNNEIQGNFTVYGICENFIYGRSEVCHIDFAVEKIKPYLFPLSSMTDRQRIELYKALGAGYQSHYHLSKEWEDFNNSIDNNDLFLPASWCSDLNKMYNYLNKNHFDYRELIYIGLAIDATGLNIY